MTDCDHRYNLESIESSAGAKAGPFTASLLCSRCQDRRLIRTLRTETEILAELAGQ